MLLHQSHHKSKLLLTSKEVSWLLSQYRYSKAGLLLISNNVKNGLTFDKGINKIKYSKNSEQLEKKSLNSFFSNKSVVFTGTLATLSRDEAKYRAKTKGAKILSNVSNNTDYVIVGEKSGSKAEKAKHLGIKILNEEDFLKKISE